MAVRVAAAGTGGASARTREELVRAENQRAVLQFPPDVSYLRPFDAQGFHPKGIGASAIPGRHSEVRAKSRLKRNKRDLKRRLHTVLLLSLMTIIF